MKKDQGPIIINKYGQLEYVGTRDNPLYTPPAFYNKPIKKFFFYDHPFLFALISILAAVLLFVTNHIVLGVLFSIAFVVFIVDWLILKFTNIDY